MIEIERYIYKEGNSFYLDTENYETDVKEKLPIPFEDGDVIKWVHEGKLMKGTLKQFGYDNELFKIVNVKEFI